MSKTKEEVISFRLSKSGQDLKAVESLIASKGWNVAINRLYYAAFQPVSALLYHNEIKVKAHSGAKAMLELHFIKTGKLSVDWGRFYARLFIVIMKTSLFSLLTMFFPNYHKRKNSLTPSNVLFIQHNASSLFHPR